MPLSTVNVSGKDINAAITDDCVVLTVITWDRYAKAQGVPDGIDVKEHDSFVEAMTYVDRECVDGGWDRVYIINPERLRYKEQ